MARRSEHTQEQLRKMVLEAAENIVIEEGFNALTVRKVAMEIGYTVGSIYMVYANMDDLIMHVKAKALDELTEQMRDIKPPASVEQHIQSLADIYLNFAYQHFNRWNMIFDAQSSTPVPDWYQQKVNNMFVIAEEHFQRLLPAQPAESVRLAARALWCGVHGICVLSLNGSLGGVGAANAEASVNLLVQNFIRGWKQKAHQASA